LDFCALLRYVQCVFSQMHRISARVRDIQCVFAIRIQFIFTNAPHFNAFSRYTARFRDTYTVLFSQMHRTSARFRDMHRISARFRDIQCVFAIRIQFFSQMHRISTRSRDVQCVFAVRIQFFFTNAPHFSAFSRDTVRFRDTYTVFFSQIMQRISTRSRDIQCVFAISIHFFHKCTALQRVFAICTAFQRVFAIYSAFSRYVYIFFTNAPHFSAFLRYTVRVGPPRFAWS
jgi:hypothetical protein